MNTESIARSSSARRAGSATKPRRLRLAAWNVLVAVAGIGLFAIGCASDAKRTVATYQIDEEALQTAAKRTQWFHAADEAFRRGTSLMGSSTNAEDQARALSLCRQAAEQNHPDAQFTLGKYHEHGMGGQPDGWEAVRWYWTAATNGHVLAIWRLKDGVPVPARTVHVAFVFSPEGRLAFDLQEANYRPGMVRLKDGRLRHKAMFSGTITAMDVAAKKSVKLVSGMSVAEVETAARAMALALEKGSVGESRIGGTLLWFKDDRLTEIESAHYFARSKTRTKMVFDSKGLPFPDYDAALVAAVEKRWRELIDGPPATARSGKVVVDFFVSSDGSIPFFGMGTDVGNALSQLCRRAVLDAAPFPKWPEEMRRIIGRDRRAIRLTFYY